MSLARRLTLCLSLTSALPAMAATARPLPRLEVVAAGEVLRLGDLFQHAGRHAEGPVFRSPDPGHTG